VFAVADVGDVEVDLLRCGEGGGEEDKEHRYGQLHEEVVDFTMEVRTVWAHFGPRSLSFGRRLEGPQRSRGIQVGAMLQVVLWEGI
jgi:hypothetical protein